MDNDFRVTREMRQAWFDQGLCWQCGERRDRFESKRCQPCRQFRNRKTQKRRNFLQYGIA